MGKLSQRRKKGRIREIRLTEEETKELMRVVRDDLVFLKSLDYRRPSRTDVRVASSILRRLLHEGMYQTAWTMAGLEGEPSILAVDLQAIVAELQPHHIQYAYAGGAETDGAHHKGYVLLAVPRVEAEAEGYDAAAEQIGKLIKPGVTRVFSLSQFLQSPAVISGKAAVSRLDVVRYVANKLGGVHWDNVRKAWSDPVGSRHRLLDEEHLLVGRLPAPLYEVVSIAQAIASSNGTVRFIERVAAVAPEQERGADVLSFREGRIGKYADITFGPGAIQ